MRKTWIIALAVTVAPCALSCQDEVGKPPPATAAAVAASAGPGPVPVALALPQQLAGKAEVVPKGDPDEARADLASAVKAAGEGGLTRGIVVRMTADVPIWRMWSGPTKKYDGRTNRMGQWWSYDAPHGTQSGYRIAYEICASWNDLTYMARCTLKKGAVVAIGPGNSVSANLCGGNESYPENPRDWQVHVAKIWQRSSEVDCPPDTGDYEADLADISQPKKVTAAIE